MRKLFPLTVMIFWLAALSACGTISAKLDELGQNDKADYKKSRSLPPLEVPPDLTSSTIDESLVVPDITPSGSATFSAYTGERNDPAAARTENVLPTQDTVHIEREGDKRWLVIKGEPAQIWPKVREFFIQSGFLIKQEDPKVGIMETDWMENRADIPKDPIRSVLSKVFDSLYSAATRDKFRVRLERGKEDGTTELYISHRGVEEVVKGSEIIWQSRPSDPELEVEMLNRLVVSFGVDEQKAKTLLAQGAPERPRTTLTRDAGGQATLTVEEDFSRAWRRTGLALDRVGFTVEDRDRSRGLYFVRYADPLKDEKKDPGFLSKLKFWGGKDDKAIAEQYLVSLISAESKTRIAILDKDGKPENSDTSNRILSLLEEQLK